LLLTWQEAQGVGDGDMCVPVKVKRVALWSNDAASQPCVVWQVEQFASANADPAVEWGGALVFCQSVKWQPEVPQAVGAIINE
jgi:hypothetical protein